MRGGCNAWVTVNDVSLHPSSVMTTLVFTMMNTWDTPYSDRKDPGSSSYYYLRVQPVLVLAPTN